MSGRQSKKNNREGNEMRTEYYSVGCFLLYSETKSSRMIAMRLLVERRSFSAILVRDSFKVGFILTLFTTDLSSLFIGEVYHVLHKLTSEVKAVTMYTMYTLYTEAYNMSAADMEM